MQNEVKENNLLKISGYASIFNVVDRSMDMVMPGCFHVDSEDITQIKLLWQHDVSQPIGYLTLCQEDDIGLYIEGFITTDTQCGQEAVKLIQSGIVSGLSMGFNILNSHLNEDDIRCITQVVIYEVSVVSVPANQFTTINLVS